MTKEELFCEFQSRVQEKRESLNKSDCPEGYPFEEYQEGWRSAFSWATDILAKLISDQPSLPSNLDEAADKFAVLYDQGTCDGIAQECFKAGAEWAGQGVSLSHLIAWYIQSVDAHEPVWTKEHLEELVKDYILIPKK